MVYTNTGSRVICVGGARKRAEGMVAGASDLLLLIPREKYHGFCLEAKTETGRQSPEQKAWQTAVEAVGYKYRIFRSTEEFMNIVNEYLENEAPE